MIYFVTEEFLKRNTPIQDNVDATDLSTCVRTSSDMTIQPILGTFFYDSLLVKYNSQSLSPEETTLVSYIQPCVAWNAASEAVKGLSRQLKNKGMQKQFGEFSSEVDFKELSFYIDDYKQKSDFYVRRLSTYLKKNKSSFPDYISDENKDSNIEPKAPDNTYNNNSFFSA